MNSQASPIVGIDLGTTNSVVAAYLDGRIQVLEENGEAILPSIVGLTMDGKLIVGKEAKNQLAAFPERTIASVKRRMGEDVTIAMGDQTFRPQEISAMILRRLRQRAERALGTEVTRAVITVPAFFDEGQRQATREAGQLAGLTVERIINEPTAASLAYHSGKAERRHLIVYDLGGGTFDVSIVRMESGVVEVLSSKGDTRLGGDDFDELLTKHVAAIFLTQHGFDLMAQATTRWRLMQACERAKCELSTVATTRITEEFIATVNGTPLHLDLEVTRHDYEQLIAALVERTIECVDTAIRDANLSTAQLDELILVGGSTRTPLVQQRLREEFHRDPMWSVSPDLAVALGAATQAAMQEGHDVGPILIDVATHTLGIAALTDLGFAPELRFSPIIHRNSPLPASYEQIYQTVSLDQEAANIDVFQGEHEHLSRNRKIGSFKLTGLNARDDRDGSIAVRFELTLDGTLRVSAKERISGLSNGVVIDNALSEQTAEAQQFERDRLDELFNDSEDDAETDEESGDEEPIDVTPTAVSSRTIEIDSATPAQGPHLLANLDKAKSLRSGLSGEDAADVDRLVELIEQAQRDGNQDLLVELDAELDDLIFYLTD